MTGKTKISLLPACCLTASLIILSFLSTTPINAQEYSLFDSLKIGVKYKIILFNEAEIIGKLSKTDSVNIEINNEQGTTRIKKDDIFTISRDLTPSNFKAMISVGGGIAFPSGDFFSNHNNYFEKSFSFQLNGSFFLSSGKLLRIDLGYSKIKRKTNPYSSNATYSGGDMNLFSFRADFLAGEINTKSDFIAYGLAGFGFHYTYIPQYTRTDNWSWDTTHNVYISTYPEEERMNAVLCVGGGLGFKITPKLGVYSEIQYNMITYGGFVFFGSGTAYIPVRLGVTYFIY